MVRRTIVALALCVGMARAEDYYYAGFRREPVPPVSEVGPVAVEDEGPGPSCVAANEACEEPGSAAPDERLAMEVADGG